MLKMWENFSSTSGIHLVLLPQSSQHGIVVVEVEPWADVEIGDDTFPHPFIDGARADRKSLGEFFLFDQGAGGDRFRDLLYGVAAVDGGVICCKYGFHDDA